MNQEIGILNLGMGNLRSVSSAIDALGYDYRMVGSAEELDSLDHLVIPGVGAFHTAMKRMTASGLMRGVAEFAASRRPMLGLCLGMQLLASDGEEGEPCPGLDLIAGHVQRFDDREVPAVPHVGWNSVDFLGEHPVLEGMKSGTDFYFVHSYRLVVTSRADILGTTTYAVEIPSIVGHNNVLGFQFHPEKSQSNGLSLLQNFCEWDGSC